MSGSIESKKSEVAELRGLLRSPEVQKDPKRYLNVVQKVIACMTLGIDVSKLFSEMIMASATHDLVQKKLVYLYLGNYAESNSELALLTVNTLQKDGQDRNPVIRGLALRSMCSLRIPNILEYLREPLQTGLADKSAYVRRTAVMGIVKIFYVAPEFVAELNLVDVLYQMLRDRDPQVVANCVCALNEILAGEGGMVVNTKITHYLLNRMRDFSEWSQCLVMEQLLRYKPSSEDEVLDLLNVLDERLKHANSAVALAAIRLFLHLTADMPQLQEEVYQRIRTPLLIFLGSTSPELVFTCLQHIQLLLARQPDLWIKDYQNFFCRYNDAPYVKTKKLELLTELCRVENARSIVDELGEYSSDVNVQVSHKAIQAIGHIALGLSARANICVDKLLSLLALDIDYITSETLVAITNILRKFDNLVEVILPQLPASYEAVPDPEGRAALTWILGEYGEALPNTPYLLEELVNNVSDESSTAVKLQLLSAVAKMFFKRPPECQEMLGRLLEHTIEEEGDMDVHDRGMLYYRLLRQDVHEAQRVICGQGKLVAEENTVVPRLSLFPEFNTLSVMYGEQSSLFITQECPFIMRPANSSVAARSGFELLGGESDDQSSRAGYSPSSPRSHRDEVTDGKLEIPGPPVPGTPPVIFLNPKCTMAAGDFEQNWLAMKTVKEAEVGLDYVPAPKELEKALASRFVMTMASSQADQPVVKFFFYAQHVSTLHIFLMEVNITMETGALSLVLKCGNPSQSSVFLTHYLQTLVANNWLTSSSSSSRT